MNLLDLFILIPIAWYAYKGFSRGLVLELAMLIGLVAGIYLSLHYSYFTENLLADTFHLNSAYLPIVSFIITFLAVAIVFYLVGKIITKLFEIASLGFFNKLLGLVFGVVKAFILVSLLIFVIQAFDRNDQLIAPKVKEGSFLYTPVAKIIFIITPWIDFDKFTGKERNTEASKEYFL